MQPFPPPPPMRGGIPGTPQGGPPPLPPGPHMMPMMMPPLPGEGFVYAPIPNAGPPSSGQPQFMMVPYTLTERERRRARKEAKLARRRKQWRDVSVSASQGNSKRHPAYRRYFTDLAQEFANQKDSRVERFREKGTRVISREDQNGHVVDPVLREELKRLRKLYLASREPAFMQPERERGWNNRAGIVGSLVNKKVHMYRRYTQDGSGLHDYRTMPTGLGDTTRIDDPDKLPYLGQDDTEQKGSEPDPQATNKPKPFLRKYSGMAVSPFLASVRGLESPYDTILRARRMALEQTKQRREEEKRFRKNGLRKAATPTDPEMESYLPSGNNMRIVRTARKGGQVNREPSLRPSTHQGRRTPHNQRPTWNDRHTVSDRVIEYNHRPQTARSQRRKLPLLKRSGTGGTVVRKGSGRRAVYGFVPGMVATAPHNPGVPPAYHPAMHSSFYSTFYQYQGQQQPMYASNGMAMMPAPAPYAYQNPPQGVAQPGQTVPMQPGGGGSQETEQTSPLHHDHAEDADAETGDQRVERQSSYSSATVGDEASMASVEHD